MRGSDSANAAKRNATKPRNFSSRVQKILHRHHQADGISHNEHELRYIRPKDFEPPKTLAGLEFAQTKRNPHRDWYFDVKGGKLRENSCSLRVRRRSDGSLTVTFKVKLLTEGARTIRKEIEHQLFCPACDQHGCPICMEPTALLAAAEGPAITAAREITGGKQTFAHLFTVVNDRTDHHYMKDGNHLVLSEDNLLYPDGSKEKRVEIEHVEGSLKLMDKAEKEMTSAYKKIKPALRGKQREARQRMRKLLDV